MVNVMDARGNMLKPTRNNAAVRALLKEYKAVKVAASPFTIQLKENVPIRAAYVYRSRRGE